MTQWWLAPLVLLISLLMTAVLRRYALARSIIDIPNARSSHVVPTPRGGGVAIVVSFLLALVLLGVAGVLDPHTVFAVAGAGGLIAIIGFMDDHGHIAARWRLLGHFIAAAWGLFWLGGLPPLTVFGVEIDLGWVGAVLAAVYLVWLLNLYNFMDGIDGIASVEAICVCLGACVLYWMSGFEQLMALPVILIMAVGGFLYWNFPPAKIFMGDAGSGFLGIALGLLSLQAACASSQLFWCWLILLGVFVVDATFTLIRRLFRGDKVYEAHRSHAYQFASRRVGGHLPVTVAVALLTLCWLLPVAACVMLFGMDGFVGLLIAYVPLVALAVAYNAGGVE
ncbi:glycosyltransferase family 4 protein [Pseudomonas mosselii]|uniref:MraY family glycosyltransferase n=1 Tax=Pseudomonas mosselii TaxID=78327 RepID=UPI000BB4A16E|nr:glycosyltransferase family 4 protein [Pseudomonas mosselii]ATB64093.1 glycosyl transferase [Pseudomonas mosselii]MDH1099546.1 glycosyltransferase family 4 protein [Pseudomonas mosselii]